MKKMSFAITYNIIYINEVMYKNYLGMGINNETNGIIYIRINLGYVGCGLWQQQ